MALNKVSKFGVAEGLIFETDASAEPKEPVIAVTDISETNIKKEQSTPSEYTLSKEETRSQRLQIVVKPSINKKLDKLVKQKKIKSKNDLINFLLEDYLERN